jgi:hypothetical protein
MPSSRRTRKTRRNADSGNVVKVHGGRLRIALAFLLAGWLATDTGFAQAPAGTKPNYTARDVTPVPNAQALLATVWLPGLGDGYVPQGIVLLGNTLYVSAYKSTDRNQDRGPCRVFSLDPKTGETLAQLDLPKACGHAGGLALGTAGHLLVTDTRLLFEIELAKPAGKLLGRLKRTVRLSGAVKGSFAASDRDSFWIGEYAREAGGKLFRFPRAALERTELTSADALEVLALPAFSQGAAIDNFGALWIIRSGSKLGELVQLDRRSGTIVARHAMPVGAEGISFAPDGSFWTLSEAGSQRWNDWPAFYPLAFRFDPKRLQ